MSNCIICNSKLINFGNTKLLNKYDVDYYYCENCGFLNTEKPYWLDEAYKNPINVYDTGILDRNSDFSRKTANILYNFFGINSKCLDFAGGYGIFVRLMRDIGFDFFWNDKYCTNIVARGFEQKEKDTYAVATAFECFEHFVDPLKEIENILKTAENIIFSTMLFPENKPKPGEWWYYAPEHGQHISFYSLKTLEYLAKKFNKNLYSNGANFHLFSSNQINEKLFGKILQDKKGKFFAKTCKNLISRTITDMECLIEENTN